MQPARLLRKDLLRLLLLCHVATTRSFQPWRMIYTPTGKDITRLLAIGRAIAAWDTRA